MADRPAGGHAAASLWPASLSGLGRTVRPACLADGEFQCDGSAVPLDVAAGLSNHTSASHGRLSVSLPASEDDSGFLPADAGPHPGGRAAAGAVGRWTPEPDGSLRRPALHGRRVPAARDQERRPVCPALRDDLVRQRTRLYGNPDRRLTGDRGGAAGRTRSVLAPVPGAAGGARGRLGRAAGAAPPPIGCSK